MAQVRKKRAYAPSTRLKSDALGTTVLWDNLESAAARQSLISRNAIANRLLAGLALLLVSLTLAFAFRDVTPLQAAILATVTGVAAALVTSGLEGVIKLQTKYLSATGPFAAFALTWWSIMATGAPEVLPHLTGLLGGITKLGDCRKESSDA